MTSIGDSEKLAHYERLLQFVKDLHIHGLRCDLNPTVSWRDEQSLASAYLNYLKQIDNTLRSRAASALEFVNVPSIPDL